jgi:uncharacterized membrane protein YkvA (DUF1232 family)
MIGCENIPDEQKHFTQRRKAAKHAKKTKQLFFAIFASLRLCVKLAVPKALWTAVAAATAFVSPVLGA